MAASPVKMIDRQVRALSNPLLLMAFALIAVLIGWDLVSDYAEGVEPLHVVVELTLLLLAAVMFGYVLTTVVRARRRLARLHDRLDSTQVESQQWRERYQSAIQGLSEGIHEQFKAWQLSKAEAEIALLLLKGLSLKEVAAVRETQERTAREQARAVYRKAGLSGRSELSAFFLEDLLLLDVDLKTDEAEPGKRS